MSTKKPDEQIEQVVSSISLKSLVSGLKQYKATYIAILKERGKFAALHLLCSPQIALRLGLSTFLYGVALSFLFYLPLMIKHGLEIDKLHFLLESAYSQFILVLLVHISARIFHGKGSLSTTASAYCCWVGVVSPTLLILDYPLFTFVPVPSFVNPLSIPLVSLVSLPLWVHIWNAVVFIGMLVLTFLIPLRWLSDIHRISRLRLIAALIVIYFPVMSLHNILIAPYVAKGLEIFSKFLSKLI